MHEEALLIVSHHDFSFPCREKTGIVRLLSLLEMKTMRIIVPLVAAVVALATIGAAQAETVIGLWSVSLGKDCRIWQEWTNEDKSTALIGIGYIDRGKSLVLAFGDSRWKLKQDEDLRIVLNVNDEWKEVFPGSAIEPTKAAAFLLPVSSAAINALMNGSELLMDIEGKGEDYSYAYDLDDDTTKAITALDACRFETGELGSDEPEPTGKPTITGAVLSLTKGGSSPQTVFDVQTPRIHLTIQVADVTDATVARIDWIAEKVEAVPSNINIANLKLKLKASAQSIDSWMDKPETGWRAGDYRVDLLIDNKPAQSLRFRIK